MQTCNNPTPEEGADLYFDHIHWCQDNSNKWPPTGHRIGLPVSLALWVAQHFENAVHNNAEVSKAIW
jgi:hypothetical protein